MLIGATRCIVICENTVLLETQEPCGRVRTCDVDTVTDDISAQVKDFTPVTLGFTFAGDKNGGGIRFDVFSSTRFASAVKY